MNATAIIRRGRSQPRVRTQAKVRSQILPMSLQGGAAFFAVFILGSFVLTLSGQILAEGQRAQIKAMSKPLMVVREEHRSLQTSASSDKSQESIEEWATQRGFIRKYAPEVRQDTYVAER